MFFFLHSYVSHVLTFYYLFIAIAINYLFGISAIFGPTDTAFTEAGITDGASLEQAVLLRHGVFGEYTSATIAATPCQEIASLAGPILVIQTAADGSTTVNGGM